MEQSTKICRLCGKKKPLSEFRVRGDSGRRRTECKQCLSQYLKKYRKNNKERMYELGKQYRETHKDELSEYRLNWQRSHREKCHEYNKRHRENMTEEQRLRLNAKERRYRSKWRKDPEYIERVRRWNRESSKRRRKKITAYELERKKNDPVFKLKKQIRGEIRTSFNRRGFRKSERTEVIVGCSLTELYEHLCMTYRIRYGKEYDGSDAVHIDHVVPLSNAKTKEEVIKLCKWDNLQLLTAEDNLQKNANANFPSYMDFIK